MRLICPFSLRTLVLCSALVSWTLVEGAPRVVGPSQLVVSTQGGDAILPCHVEPLLSVEEMAVEWSRPDVPADRWGYVHRYRDNRDVEDVKMSSYAGRTSLFRDELKHGNMSLKIVNLKLSDQGSYVCFVPQLMSLKSSTVIRLVVEPRTTETPLQPGTQTPPLNQGGEDKGDRAHLILWTLPPLACTGLLILVGRCVLTRRRQRRGSVTHDADPSKPAPP